MQPIPEPGSDRQQRTDLVQAGPNHAPGPCTERTIGGWVDLLEAVLAALQQLLEVGLLVRSARRPLPPGATVAAPSATATTLIVPRHLRLASSFSVLDRGVIAPASRDGPGRLSIPHLRRSCSACRAGWLIGHAGGWRKSVPRHMALAEPCAMPASLPFAEFVELHNLGVVGGLVGFVGGRRRPPGLGAGQRRPDRLADAIGARWRGCVA